MAYLDKTGLARFYDGMKSRFLLKSAVANDLTVTAAGYVLDARQGKALARPGKRKGEQDHSHREPGRGELERKRPVHADGERERGNRRECGGGHACPGEL